MAVQQITFNPYPRNLQYVGQARVWWKRLWSDEWEVADYLEVDELNWCAAPSLPTASLTWHYGRIARPGVFGAFTNVPRLGDKQRYYLKITAELEYIDNSWISKDWYGVLDIVEDQIGGTIYIHDGVGGQTLVPRGEQALTAYGLESLLQDHFVTTSRYAAGSVSKQLPRGLTFNERGLPNRHASRVSGDWHFANSRADARYWTSAQIIEYLLEWHTPRPPGSSTAKPQFRIESADIRNLPDWDQPELPTDGIRTYDLLNQLIPRQRLLGWYLGIETVPDDHPFPPNILLRTFTYTPEQINVSDSSGGTISSIPGNPQHLHLILDRDPTAAVALKDSNAQSYDQVVFRGARRRSCCTLRYGDGLVKGWTDDHETEYEAGASTAPDYPAAGETKKREQRNQEARSSDRLRAVFRRYDVDPTWAGLASGQPVFPVHDPLHLDPAADIATNGSHPHYALGLALSPTLPLLAGVDYTGDKIQTKTFDVSTAPANRAELPTLVAWQIPASDPTRYGNVEELGRNAALEKERDAEDHTWSANVRVLEGTAAIELNVHGGQQHVLAKTDFTPLAEDGTQSDHDWRNMLVTLCVVDDRYCEGRYPAEPPVARAGDGLRILILDAGEAYQQDYVVVDTVIGIEATTGQLQRSSGGYVRNDTRLLTSAAQVAYEWYQQTRRVLTAATACPVDLSLGAMIVKVNDPASPSNALEVNSPLTSIRWIVGRGAPDAPPPAPQMVYTTAAGELDPLRTIGRRTVSPVVTLTASPPAAAPAARPNGVFPSINVF